MSILLFAFELVYIISMLDMLLWFNLTVLIWCSWSFILLEYLHHFIVRWNWTLLLNCIMVVIFYNYTLIFFTDINRIFKFNYKYFTFLSYYLWYIIINTYFILNLFIFNVFINCISENWVTNQNLYKLLSNEYW